jgi:gliding motility-associated protein GldE
MLLLLFGSAFFSASENAFFSLGPADNDELENDDSSTSTLIKELLERPKKLLATILIGNNIVNVGIAVLSTIFIEQTFEFHNETVKLVIQVIVVTFIILLLGEVMPKVYATQNPLKTARIFARPLSWLETIFHPLSYVMVKGTGFLDKRVKQNTSLSVDQLSQALELTNEDSLDQEENNILRGIVNFGNTDVTQVMRPRIDVKAIEASASYDEMLALVKDYGYSRVPIYNETLDQVVGILHIKDLLPHLQRNDDFEWLTLIRKPFYVPENKKIDDLMKDFQAKKIHLAVVVDEYGGTSGIVTFEDIIEEIVGEINDEFDEDDITYTRLDDHNFVFEGKTLLNDIYRLTGIDSDEFDKAKGESETVAGFILEITGSMPVRGQEVEFNGYKFKIESVDNRRIKRVKLVIPEEGITG